MDRPRVLSVFLFLLLTLASNVHADNFESLIGQASSTLEKRYTLTSNCSGDLGELRTDEYEKCLQELNDGSLPNVKAFCDADCGNKLYVLNRDLAKDCNYGESLPGHFETGLLLNSCLKNERGDYCLSTFVKMEMYSQVNATAKKCISSQTGTPQCNDACRAAILFVQHTMMCCEFMVGLFNSEYVNQMLSFVEELWNLCEVVKPDSCQIIMKANK